MKSSKTSKSVSLVRQIGNVGIILHQIQLQRSPIKPIRKNEQSPENKDRQVMSVETATPLHVAYYAI
ncbi:MAG: hypothetical protein ACRDEA_16490 [Microcystaceae cyanobacterium]